MVKTQCPCGLPTCCPGQSKSAGRVCGKERANKACQTFVEALHPKGLITDPHGRHESIYLTEQGLARAKLLVVKHFGVSAHPEAAH